MKAFHEHISVAAVVAGAAGKTDEVVIRPHDGARCRPLRLGRRIEKSVALEAQLARVNRHVRLRQLQRAADNHAVGEQAQLLDVPPLAILPEKIRGMVRLEHERLAGNVHREHAIAYVVEQFLTGAQGFADRDIITAFIIGQWTVIVDDHFLGRKALKWCDNGRG